jgi:chemotaxis family two-component system response regulator PixG
MELGADDYLIKPFTKAELLGAIASRLKKQALLVQYAEQLIALRASNNHQTKQITNQNTISDNHQTEYHNINTLALEFASLKSAQFTGKFLVKADGEQEWIFYLYQGRIVYAAGGMNSVRRWQRNLATHCPQIQVNQLHLPGELFSREAWEYLLLGLLLKQQLINREQVGGLIQESVTEVLFDILQSGQIKYQTQPENPLPFQLLLIEFEQIIAATQKLWQSWEAANLTNLLPNKAPIIKHPQSLQQKTSPALYRQLTMLLDGQRTLRDLAIQMKRQVTDVTLSLLPYIRADMVELVEIPDLPKPNNSAAPASPPAPPAPPAQPAQAVQATPEKTLIACIDDSPLICQTIEQILTAAGYQFMAIQDPLRAISTLLSRKPNFIFLDLVMPNLNGYEICAKLRQISHFRATPIVLLSGNAIDPVRVKEAGVSDSLEKPMQPEIVLKIVEKYLSKTTTGVS